MNVRQNRELFFRWLAKNHPVLYAPVAREVSGAPGMGALGWVDSLINAIAQVGGAVMAKKAADKQSDAAKKQAANDAAARADALKVELLNINLQRAQAGLPPVDEYGRVLQSAQVPALPSPAHAAQVAQSYAAYASINWPIVAGAGAAGLLALYLLSRR
jgi:hypothetical protein